MKSQTRHLAIVFVALLLAVGLGTGTDLPDANVAEAQLGTTWDISATDTSNTSSGPSGTRQNRTSDSRQTSDDGQTEDDHQSSQKNEDGSGSEQENFTHDDEKCRKAGGFSKHTVTDKDGNSKVHHQEVWYENGKCEIVIWDEVCDKNKKCTQTPPERYPCSQYKLEMKLEGSLGVDGGEVTWGPNKAVIPLTQKDRTYKGSYEGQFNASIFGECNGYAMYPVSFQVTAAEDEFEDLDFTLKGTIGYQVSLCCEGGCGSNSIPNVPASLNFTLPAQDGASKIFSMPSGGVRYTFTLRKQCK